MVKVKEITDYLLKKYPLDLASDFDSGKIGLQFGSMSAPIKKVMLALDGTKNVIDEAIDKKVDLLILHHPFMFSPLLNLDYDSVFGKKLLKVFDNRLNIFAMHTNFDVAKDGMNFILANLLELKNIKSINNEIDNNSFLRIGDTDKVSLEEFAAFVKKKLNEKYVRVIGDETRKVRKVAVVGGAGSSFVLQAKKLGCDAIVTGEIHHNNAIDALEWNMAVVEVSHSVEGLYKETILSDLSKNFESVEFVLSCTDNNPFKWI